MSAEQEPIDLEAADPMAVLDAWWSIGETGWFTQSDETDTLLTQRFEGLVNAARAGLLGSWKDAPHSALALMLLLDQFPRNIFRGTPDAFASDRDAVQLADHVRARGFDFAYPGSIRAFYYMPYMHAEDLALQTLACDLFRALGDHNGYHYALVHMDAIRRFGRFPHRNAILGRVSTPDEEAYLASGSFAA